MTREKALQAMDRLVEMGYTATLTERDMGAHGMVFVGDDGSHTTVSRSLSIRELSIDKVDLKALVAAADELGLDAGLSGIGPSEIVFTDAPTDAEVRKRDVVCGRRPHPR